MKIRHLLFLLLSLPFHCQNFHSLWYTTDNGLPQNSVKDIIKDKYGLILLSTDDGILRYDGNSFQSFNGINFKNSHFKFFRGSIKKDSIYISNQQDKNSVFISRRAVKPVSHQQLLEDDEIFQGIQYRKYFKTNLTESITDKYYSIDVCSGRYYFTENLIIYYNTINNKRTVIPVDFKISEIKKVFAHGDKIFIPNQRTGEILKIFRGTIQSITEQNKLFTDRETKIYWSQINDQSFVINNDDIYLCTLENDELILKKITTYPNFGNFQFFCMYFDAKFNTLFLGSLTKGLNIITPHRLNTVKKNIPYKSDIYYTFLPFNKKEVITPDGYVFSTESKLLKLPFNENNSANSIIYDEFKNIVCFSNSTLDKYLYKNGYLKKERIDVGFSIENIFKAGSNYFLTTNDGEKTKLFIYKDSYFQSVAKTITFSSNISIVASYNESSILVGTIDDLYSVNTQTYKVNKISKNGIGVKNICKTNGSLLWILTFSDGMFLLKEGELIKVPVNDEKSLASPHFIYEDRSNFFWISTNNGLYKIFKKDLLKNLKKQYSDLKYYKYTTKDGLGSNEFNGGGKPCGAVMNDGSIVLPSMDGIVFVNPNNLNSLYPDENKIFVERVRVNNEAIQYFTKTLTLPKGYKNATFYIDLPYYADNDNLVIETKMGEGENSWIRLKDRTLTVNELGSGEHTLIIRILVNDKGHYIYKKVDILINPHFYETLWFFLLCVIMACILVFAIVQYRTCKLTAIVSNQDKEIDVVQKNLLTAEGKLKIETDYQESVFQAITHDIATPIKHLSNLSQMMTDTDDQELQKKYFESVYRSTEELYKMTISLREYRFAFNNASFTEVSENLFEVVDRKILLFQDLASYNHTTIINKIDKNTEVRINKSILGIIFQNLLDNAVKNTHSGKIVFNSEVRDGYLNIIIEDTGSGMSAAIILYYNQLNNDTKDDENSLGTLGLGLHLVIRLVKKINANIQFINNEPKGTIVIIKIKTNV